MTARSGPGLLLGAGRALLGLPTAFPYFAAIAVIVASGVSVPQQASLLLLYNAAFVAPVIAIFVILIAFGSRADGVLKRASEWVERNWPPMLAALALIVGLAILGLGISGLV
jgi:cytochrome c biogenesis protein CcdA